MSVNTLLAIRTSERLDLIEMRQLAINAASAFGHLANVNEIYTKTLDTLTMSECNHVIELPIVIGHTCDADSLTLIHTPKVTGVLVLDLTYFTSTPTIFRSPRTSPEIAKDMFIDIKADINNRLIGAFELAVPEA